MSRDAANRAAALAAASGIATGAVNASGKQRLIWMAIPLAIGLLAPSLVLFYVEVFVGDIPPAAAAADIMERQFSEGDNLFLITAAGLVPFVVLSITCAVAASRFTPARLACLGVGGLAGILGLMVPGHLSVWYPLYGSGQTSSTAVLAFMFLPLYYLATLAIGVFVGWLVSLLPAFRHAPASND